VCFGTYVSSELVTEADYDKNPGANLELAARISTAVDGDVTHAAVNAAAEELRERTKDSAKVLRSILDSVKEPKEMTQKQASEAITKVLSNGFLTLVIAAVGAEIAHVEDTEIARNAFFGMITANDMFSANMVTEKGEGGKPVLILSGRASAKVLGRAIDALRLSDRRATTDFGKGWSAARAHLLTVLRLSEC